MARHRRGRSSNRYSSSWAPYVSVAERREEAIQKIAALQKKGKKIFPIQVEGRTIARTFWGKSWCENLENYSDFSNRLPRGRSYLRNGSVLDLQIEAGAVHALVNGSSVYNVKIGIRSLDQPRWKAIIDQCSGKIDSLVELLQGKFSKAVMEIITCPKQGLFPSPQQISMTCSCPDSATMCKHVAAVLYGVGARLDDSPELFFKLRNVDHAELITAAGAASTVAKTSKTGKILESNNLSDIFGIDLDIHPGETAKIEKAPKAVKKTRSQTNRR